MNTTKSKASHVNTGTSISRDELAKPTMNGRVTRLPKLHVETDTNPKMTPYGGLVLVAAFLKRFHVAEAIDEKVSVLKQHKPYHESDHALALALSLYVGGTCLEDLSTLQHSEAARRMLGACRIPDPTTSGDFLRRFDEDKNPGSLEGLRHAIDEIQRKVWKSAAGGGKPTKKNKGVYKSRRAKRDRPQLEAIDLDAHIKEVCGVQKEGADFSHNGKWSFKPLLISRASTGECLAIRNRPGNAKDPTGAADALDETLHHVRPEANAVVVRGDSAFDQRDIRSVCETRDAYSAIVGRADDNRLGIALSLPESDWEPFRTGAARKAKERQDAPGYRPRRKKANRRRKRARERGYKEKRLVTQWLAEVPYQPAGSDKMYRLIMRRQLIEESAGQMWLDKEYRFRYRFVVTDLPVHLASTEQVIDLTYERCDQEKVIEQMGNGLPLWRMPVREFAGNCAWLEIARLAWNLAKWIALLALPEEVVRWEWKRFRNAFVNLAAEVIKRSRQTWVRFHGAYRSLGQLLDAHERLQV